MKSLTLRRTVITLAILSGLLAITAVAAALLGPEHIGLGRAIAILTGRDTPLADSDIGRTILLHIRLPRIVLAALVGATLAVTGAVLQSILRNPLAEPHLIGVSSGAALGVMIAGLVDLPGLLVGLTTTSVLAFGGGLSFPSSFVFQGSRTMDVTLEAKMIKIPKQEYTAEFKTQAVKRVAEV
ncbi:MAG: iron chelate uptake ABC transporter family permease subunit, partial [Nitrospirae bacterium]|nr:iron chelate uptake ABC transporter family permease subunit [Nitrospirota bacterium]